MYSPHLSAVCERCWAGLKLESAARLMSRGTDHQQTTQAITTATTDN